MIPLTEWSRRRPPPVFAGFDALADFEDGVIEFDGLLDDLITNLQIGAAASTPPISRSSEQIRPPYPIFLRKMSLIHFFESDAGVFSPLVTAGKAACETMTMGNSRRSAP